MIDESEIFNRTRRLIGQTGMERLRHSRIIVFGIGGVGSWCAEALCRTGIGHLTLVDADRVAATNINRQAEATTATIGVPKVEALAARLQEINPRISLSLREERYTSESSSKFHLEEYDFIIDAIDSLSDKAALLVNAADSRHPGVASSMGAALRIDPTKIHVAEFWKVQGCPLAAALRSRLRRNGVRLRRKIACVYSDEPPLPNLGEVITDDGTLSYGKVAANGSLCHITATFGMYLAGLALQHILKNQNNAE